MRRVALLALSLGLFSGCTAQPAGDSAAVDSGKPHEIAKAGAGEDRREDQVQDQANRILAADREERASERAAAAEKGEERFENDPVNSHRARLFYLQGVHLLSEKPPRVDEAIREFQHALQADPLFFKAHFKLGYAYYHKGEYQLERAEYLKCLAIKRDYLPALINLGHAYLAQDELELARDAYRRALEIDTNQPTCLYNLGLIEFDLQKWDSSHRYLQAFLRSNEAEGEMGDQARKCLDRIREKLGTGAQD
ncbi:MAG: tetratricopeptide repeat protein [Planctomycetota bacterium]